jgi:hypothetical protein
VCSSYRPCSRCLNRYNHLHDARRMPVKCSAKCVIFRAGVLGILSRLWKSRQFRHLERSQIIEVFVMRAIHVDKCCSRILRSPRERMTFRLQRLNRLSLFSYFVLRDVTGPKKHFATQTRLGNDQNL